ncbi:MAG: dephospho-CoA kinase [Flavobacteriia bacterium]|nr:dephospho-CoA kinase [Flavobacteriia bacterium]
MKKIVVTGGIGSGKSTVCKVISQLGFPVFYSDDEAKNIITTDKDLINQIQNLLGEEAYCNNQLNKTYVANKIFNNLLLKEKMNGLVHPAVRKQFEKWCDKQNSTLVFNEAAIVFETGAYKNFDASILIVSPENIRIKRIVARDHCSEIEAKLKMANQWSDEKKMNLADFIIHNDEKKPLLDQIFKVINKIENAYTD